jgi:hypothetical protein
VPSSTSNSLPPVSRERLRALVLVANPTNLEGFGLSRLDTRRYVANVRDAMGDVPCDVLADDSDAVGPPTLEALCQQLVAQRYDLLHVIAHAVIRKDIGQNYVFFARSDGLCDPVPDDRLVSQLGAVASPQMLTRFVYLCSGYTGQGLAQRFVQDLGVPAVLGLTDLVTERILFESTKPFYSGLLAHGFADRALAEARTSLSDREDADRLVLCSRLSDGQLFPEMAAAERSDGVRTRLEITILAGGTGDNVWPVSVEHSSGSEWLAVRRGGSVQLERTRLADLDDPHNYGVFLGRILFQGAVGDAWKELQNRSPLRIALCVESVELAELHWEWLCVPIDDENWRFLAEIPDAFFSLHVNSAVAAPTRMREREHLRALTLVAGGEDLARYGLPPVNIDAVHASLARTMGDLPFETVASSALDAGLSTLDMLRRRLGTGGYDILHIVGHVRRAQADDSIALFLPEGRLMFSPSARFPLAAGINELPPFAFLCPPEGAEPVDVETLGALARELVERTGMLAALAFTAPVSLELSEAFATVFYRQLRAHGEVDRALNEACAALFGRPGFAPPALYTRLKGKRLFYEA